MGLRARISLKDWGFPDYTPILHLPIYYTDVAKMFGEQAEEMAKDVCPVDTGFLQSSIHGSGDDMEGVIEATAEYAQYVEYGTWKMNAQPYFTPAVEQMAQVVFMIAVQIYQAKLDEEQEMIEMMERMQQEAEANFMSFAPGDGTDLGGPTSGGFWGGYTQNIHGIEFHSDGSVGAGIHGYYQTRPEMWGKNTTMYKVAMKNRSNLSSYRQTAMDRFAHDNQLTLQLLSTGTHSYSGGGSSRSYSGGSRSSGLSVRGNGATRFGYQVGMYAMSSAMASGGGYFSSLLGGMLLGGIATLIGLVLGDIFGGGGPQFEMPKIEII